MPREINIEKLRKSYGDTAVDAMIARFWSYIYKDTSAPDACWPWVAKSVSASGKARDMLYGKFQLLNGQTARCNRLMVALTTGVCEADIVVAHSCNNSLCLRPDHLHKSTQADNMAFARALGRVVAPTEREGMVRRTVKVTSDMRARIKQLLGVGMDDVSIAEELGIHARTVKRHRMGQTQKHREDI